MICTLIQHLKNETSVLAPSVPVFSITVFSDNFAKCSLLYVIIYHNSCCKHKLKVQCIEMKGIWAYLWNVSSFVMMIKNRSSLLKEPSIGAKTLGTSCGCLGRRGRVFAVFPSQTCRSGPWALVSSVRPSASWNFHQGREILQTLYWEHV